MLGRYNLYHHMSSSKLLPSVVIQFQMFVLRRYLLLFNCLNINNITFIVIDGQ